VLWQCPPGFLFQAPAGIAKTPDAYITFPVFTAETTVVFGHETFTGAQLQGYVFGKVAVYWALLAAGWVT